MKVKIFDENHEKDLENVINEFISRRDVDVIDIKYQLSIMPDILNQEQIFCYSAMILYTIV